MDLVNNRTVLNSSLMVATMMEGSQLISSASRTKTSINWFFYSRYEDFLLYLDKCRLETFLKVSN